MFAKEKLRNFSLLQPIGTGENFILEKVSEEQLFFEPDWHRSEKRLNALWSKSDIGLQQSFKFYERLVIKDDVFQVFDPDTSLCETIAYGMGGKTWVVFFSRKAFLLNGRKDLPILYQASCAIVIKSRNSKDIHRSAGPFPEMPAFGVAGKIFLPAHSDLAFTYCGPRLGSCSRPLPLHGVWRESVLQYDGDAAYSSSFGPPQQRTRTRSRGLGHYATDSNGHKGKV